MRYLSSTIKKLTSNKRINLFVKINVWIVKFRKLGNLLFFLGHDSEDEIQIIVKKKETITDIIHNLKKGDLIEVKGFFKKKEGIIEGYEVELLSYSLINKSVELPFEIRDDININEETKYHFRYLDLRRVKSKNLIKKKSDFLHETRKFFSENGFIDIETPILSQKSPEGAECFIVPSNLKNRYYTLPQSPQIFKQLLMVSGFSKYYQIAKSFRNEGARSNRQIEFSQLDFELSFTKTKKIKKLIEKWLQKTLLKVFKLNIKIPFKTISIEEAQKKHKTDKPDIRTEEEKKKKLLSFVWVDKWPLFEYEPVSQKYQGLRHPFTSPLKEQQKDFLSGKVKPEELIGDAFDLVCNGEEILSGSMRIHQSELQSKFLELLGYDEKKREKYFGYFLKALDFAAPPHGGAGIGIDRLLSIIMETNNLKELIAFPKNIDGTCSLTGTPDYLSDND